MVGAVYIHRLLPAEVPPTLRGIVLDTRWCEVRIADILYFWHELGWCVLRRHDA